MKRFAAYACMVACASSWAADPAPQPPSEPAATVDASVAPVAAAQRMVLGKTTLEQARQLWAASGARVVQGGQVAVGAGSGVDGLGSVGVPELFLIDVTGTWFEGLTAARYAFVNGTLYSIQARLQPPVAGRSLGAVFPALSDDDVSVLDKRLRKTYGPPSRSGNDLAFEKNVKPHVFVWDLGARELVFSAGAALSGSQLILKHKALAKAAEKFKQAACRQHKGC